jgi:broad specificity phosphatase PhoE
MSRLIACILRHGHYHQPENVPSALLPHPLTDKGRTQAREAADGLLAFADEHGLDIHGVIDTSRLLRAWETGSIMAEELTTRAGREFKVSEHEALAERSVGAGANLTLEQIARVVELDPRFESLPPFWKSDADFKLPLQGAETLREAGARVATHLAQTVNNLRAEVTRDTVKVFVGHGAAFRYAAVKLGVLKDSEAPKLSMHHCRPVYLEATEDGAWQKVGGEWKVRAAAAMD